MEINEVEFHLNQNAFEDNTFGLRGLKTLRQRTGDGFLRARDKVEKENSKKKLSERELRNKNSSIMLSLLVLLQSSIDFEILLLINSSTAMK